MAHRRFDQTRRALETALGVTALPVPGAQFRHRPALAHLEATLFQGQGEAQPAGDQVELIEAPDREDEVRAALCWLKARLVLDNLRPGEVALLARSVPPYRAAVLQTAAEFGLPVQVIDGQPLRGNPAVAALLDLLRLLTPSPAAPTEPGLPRRLVVESGRSPYLDWQAPPGPDAAEPVGIQPSDAFALDLVARWGRVLGGLTQWQETLGALCPAGEDDPDAVAAQDDERGRPAGVPCGPAARTLQDQFQRFIRRLAPPAGPQPFRTWVGWLEDLIGPDPQLEPAADEPGSLGVVARVRAAGGEHAERDIAALQAFKDVLRGLVWAEEALGSRPVTLTAFLQELVGGVESAAYQLLIQPDRERILVAGVRPARGLPFRAVAVLGLAEGEFPAALSEDPLLRDADRRVLIQSHGLPLELSTVSHEAELFYEGITRPRERLLVTRPRLADGGDLWQPSPYWEEVRRLVRVEPIQQLGQTPPTPQQAASWSELVESIAAAGAAGSPYADLVGVHQRQRLAAWEHAARLLRHRRPRAARNHYDGDPTALADDLPDEYGPGHTWSAGRLESYRNCPFRFFVGSVLGLEPRPEPQEGLDARQLGSIYHRILEHVCQADTSPDPADTDQLLTALDAVVGRILDEAPAREGFRQTAWWPQTRQEILENVRRSLVALADLPGDFVPCQLEAVFGLAGRRWWCAGAPTSSACAVSSTGWTLRPPDAPG